MTVISFVSQKGGVGKTTSAVNIGAALVEKGYSVLGIDLDPQAGMSRHLGGMVSSAAESVRALLTGDARIDSLVRETRSGIFLVPSHPALATVAVEIEMYREQRLALALRDLNSRFDFVLIDCPPSLDLLPLNALHASNGVIIPISPEVLPAVTIPTVLRVIQDIRVLGNRPDLYVIGILPCMTRRHTRLNQMVEERWGHLAPGIPILPGIRHSVAVAEAPASHLPLLQYSPRHQASDDYRQAAKRILEIINHSEVR